MWWAISFTATAILQRWKETEEEAVWETVQISKLILLKRIQLDRQTEIYRSQFFCTILGDGLYQVSHVSARRKKKKNASSSSTHLHPFTLSNGYTARLYHGDYLSVKSVTVATVLRLLLRSVWQTGNRVLSMKKLAVTVLSSQAWRKNFWPLFRVFRAHTNWSS